MNRLPLGFSEWGIPPKNRIAHHFKSWHISWTLSSASEHTQKAPAVSQTTSESDTVYRFKRRLQRIINHVPTFNPEAKKLAEDKTKIWESCDIQTGLSRDEIDFLHLKNDGTLTTSLIRAGAKSQKEVRIEKNLVPAVWARLNAWVNWEKEAWSDSWDKPSGDRDGNSFYFSRTLDIGFWRKVRWSGKYKNNDLRVEIIEHTLEIV